MATRKITKGIRHFCLFIFLTIITQVGGLIYLMTLWLVPFSKKRLSFISPKLQFLSIFLVLYSLCCSLLVPQLASWMGREALAYRSPSLQAARWYTIALNRHYVSPALKKTLHEQGDKLQKEYPGLCLQYLDACFPFWDGFPLFPHLSHNDGQKVDLAFVYQSKEGKLLNAIPSMLGYGYFEAPKETEVNTTAYCEEKGAFQYGILGWFAPAPYSADMLFSAEANRFLLQSLAQDPTVYKIFVEPHLKTRLGLNAYDKIRFQGCRAVRHDDHIHVYSHE